MQLKEAEKLTSVITLAPIQRALCFDVSNTLTKFRVSPGRSFLSNIQKSIEMNQLHGRLKTIDSQLSSVNLERRITEQYRSTITALNDYWPDYGSKHGIDLKVWWKNVAYNTLKRVNFIDDPFATMREQSQMHNLSILSEKDSDDDSVANTKEINLNVCDTDLPSNYVTFNFDTYFENLYEEFCDHSSIELFPDSRPFIDFIVSHYYESVVLGVCTQDSFCNFNAFLNDTRMDYLDFIVTPQITKCYKPNQRFYEISRLCILEAIKRRMINAEIKKLYAKDMTHLPYDRSMRFDIEKELGTNREFLFEENVIAQAYSEYFANEYNRDQIDIVMIGNSLTKDVIPALQMGWRAVWLLRESRFEHAENDNCDEFLEELARKCIKVFGQTEWETNVKRKVIVINNLFDIHHHAFLW